MWNFWFQAKNTSCDFDLRSRCSTRICESGMDWMKTSGEWSRFWRITSMCKPLVSFSFEKFFCIWLKTHHFFPIIFTFSWTKWNYFRLPLQPRHANSNRKRVHWVDNFDGSPRGSNLFRACSSAFCSVFIQVRIFSCFFLEFHFQRCDCLSSRWRKNG